MDEAPKPTPPPPQSPAPLLGYAARLDTATMSPRRRVIRAGSMGAIVAMASFWWVAIVAVLSQLFVRGWVSAVLAAIVAVLLAVFAGACLRSLRLARGRRVLAYVAQGARLALPLPEFLRAAAAAERWPVRDQLRRLATSIAGAARLGDALRNEVPELPLRAVSIVRVASDNGTLGVALARLVAEQEPTADEAFRRRFPWLYLGVLLILLPGVCLVLSVFVMPKFVGIYRDFNIPASPWMSAVLLNDQPIVLVMLACVLIGLVVVLALLAVSFRWIVFARHDLDHPLRTLADRVAWALPGVGGALRDRDHADLCQAIADGLAARRPADVVLTEAAMLDLNAVTLDRLRAWRAAVVAGVSLGRAARVAEMPTLVADLAGDQADPTRAADAFAFLARHYRGRLDRRRDWLAAIATPLIALVAGTIVGCVAWALFDAMQRIISASMPYKVGI